MTDRNVPITYTIINDIKLMRFASVLGKGLNYVKQLSYNRESIF